MTPLPPTPPLSDPPDLDCLTAGHLYVEIRDMSGDLIGSWCLWDGGGAYDGARFSDDGVCAVPFTVSASDRQWWSR